MIDGSLIPKICTYDGSQGMKGALMACDEDIEGVEVMDLGVLMDADTKEDFEKVEKYYSISLKGRVNEGCIREI